MFAGAISFATFRAKSTRRTSSRSTRTRRASDLSSCSPFIRPSRIKVRRSEPLTLSFHLTSLLEKTTYSRQQLYTAVERRPRNREVMGLNPTRRWAFSSLYPLNCVSLIQVPQGGAKVLIFLQKYAQSCSLRQRNLNTRGLSEHLFWLYTN